MLKQGQHQKQFQRLSPQQIQIMKLLQVPTANLEERIKEELEDNPALEEGLGSNDDTYQLDENGDDDTNAQEGEEIELSNDTADKIDIDEVLKQEGDENGDFEYAGSGYTNGGENGSPLSASEATYHDHLLDQLSMLQLDNHRQQIAEQIIGSIDDDGFLRRETTALVDDLAFARNVYTTEEEVQDLINQIREFDPAGTAAWDLQDSLLLQLKRVTPKTKAVADATAILEKMFGDFIRKNYDRVQRKLEMDNATFRDAINVIVKLSPRPGAAYGGQSKAENYILPDFFMYNNGGRLELTLNSKNAPPLNVSEDYREMMTSYEKNKIKNKAQREAAQFIKQKIDRARWFIDAIRQRQHTMLQVMHAITDIQREFFLTGDEATLRPMVLRDISARTNLDISTISRVSNSKYVQTEFGTFKLKYFFSEAVHGENGEEVSSREIKSIVSEIVNEEDKSEPLSDDQIKAILLERGHPVARRTVAKYREMIGIPSSRYRKEL